MKHLDRISTAMELPYSTGKPAPVPFPGKYPTRIGMIVLWRTREGEERSWRYAGKPCALAVRKFYKILQHRGIILYYYIEWDQKWKITQTSQSFVQPTPQGVNQLEEGKSSIWMWTVYHPWSPIEKCDGLWLIERISHIHNISRVRGEHNSRRVYAPIRILGLDRVRRYRETTAVAIKSEEKKKSPVRTIPRGDLSWLRFEI